MLPYVPAGYAPANRLRATCDCSDRRQQRYTLDLDLRDQEAVEGIRDALETVLGVLAGHSPAAPSSFSVRGFTRSQITVLRDGIWLGPANMVMRPQNTFNLDRVELLRGPASVLNGQGAVARHGERRHEAGDGSTSPTHGSGKSVSRPTWTGDARR